MIEYLAEFPTDGTEHPTYFANTKVLWAYPDEIRRYLNEKGKQGWQLIQVIDLHDRARPNRMFVFSRVIK